MECPDCGPLPRNHAEKYIESIFEYVLPAPSPRLSTATERVLLALLRLVGLVKKETVFDRSKISLRTTVFMDAAEKRGWKFFVYRGPVGYLNSFTAELPNKKKIFFEGLPTLRERSGKLCRIVDDKARVKEVLHAHNIPAPPGKEFWLWKRSLAHEFAREIGFPLMVKPRSGSISHHITPNIENDAALDSAITRAVRYEPSFIVERFLKNTHVYRATVVDKASVAVVERIPAFVDGDGAHTIQELVDAKNADPRRGAPKAKNTTLYQLVIDGTTERLLQMRNVTLDSIPPRDERIFLQEKVILDLGADLFEVTPEVHPDNLELFRKVAGIFDSYLIGIDYISEDIRRSWKEARGGIIELNSLPYIDMHHFPTEGKPQDVAGWICDMVEKYYG